MTKMIRQTMFTGGEVDITTYKRTDIEGYLTCAQSLLNCEVGTTGLARKRKGTKFLLDITSYAEANSNIYEFVDSNNNYYIIVMSNAATHIFTKSGGTVAFLQTVVTPYLAADLPDVDYTQDNDSLVFTHQSYAPGRIYISNSVGPVFSFQYLNIYPYPAFDFGTIDYNNFTVSLSVTGTVLTFRFTGLGSDPGYTTDWIGGQIVGGGASVEDPIGYAIITNVTPYSAGTVTFTAEVKIPFQTSGYSTLGSEYDIRQPAWSSTLGYPGVVCFYQNRLWFGNTPKLNITVFGSQINKPINFDVGVGNDTDAIIYTIGQSGTGNISWMNGGKQFEIYCENYEFVCPQDTNTALTPSTFSIRQQSSYGASRRAKPVNYLNDSYFVSKTGKAIINFKFDGVGLAYTSTNISVASSHLVNNPLNRALLRGSDDSQDNFVYYLNSDNTITAFQFAMQYNLAALTPVQFQTNSDGDSTIIVVDLATIDNEIYMIKYYTLTNKYVLEKFVEDVKIDSYVNATMGTDGVVTGLSAFNGYTVQVIFENQDYGEWLVSGGQITVDNPNEVSGAVQVGLLYPMEIVTMYVFAGSSASNYAKQVTRIFVDYYNSLNFYINGTLVPYQTFADIQAGLPLTPQTGTQNMASVNGYNQFDTISITQNAPFDCQILGIAYQIDARII